MKKLILMAAFAGLLVSTASATPQDDKEKKGKKECCKKGEGKACAGEKKENCSAGEKKACCKKKSEGASETKAVEEKK